MNNIKTRLALLLSVIAGVAAIQCSSSKSPVSPSPTAPTVASVSLGATNAAPGSTIQGIVTLSAAAPAAGVSVALSSSDSAVAKVVPAVAMAGGAMTGTFTVTAGSVGTATITASLNGGHQTSSQIKVIAGVTLASISLSSSTVVGGNLVTGTATLTALAPAGGAVVSLTAGDPVTVPANVTVQAGMTTATFLVSTRAVGGTLPGTVTGSYGGVSASATVSVTPPTVATASFGVTGPSETNTCSMSNGGIALDCTFNGSTSTAPAPIVAWDWTFSVATTVSQTTSSAILANPAASCALLPPPPMPAGTSWFPMTVTLKVRDSAGNVSEVKSDGGIRLFPQGVCGF